mmetsp:Transcript_38694/g.80374  ORF Transcript_38694/g.80374 Transcript_38694/m.80374 type:complete len:171 (-) Transcript_38694:722-1234(-)
MWDYWKCAKSKPSKKGLGAKTAPIFQTGLVLNIRAKNDPCGKESILNPRLAHRSPHVIQKTTHNSQTVEDTPESANTSRRVLLMLLHEREFGAKGPRRRIPAILLRSEDWLGPRPPILVTTTIFGKRASRPSRHWHYERDSIGDKPKSDRPRVSGLLSPPSGEEFDHHFH